MKQKKRMAKKGNLDLILIVCLGFILAVSFLFISKVWDEIEPQLLESDAGNTTTGIDAIAQTSTTIDGMDIVFGLVFFGLLIAGIVLSFSIRTHPAMFFVTIFLLLVVGMLAMKFSNSFDEISSNSELTNQTAKFQVTGHIMSNYPKYIIIIIITVSIALYAKSKWASSGGGEF